MSRLKRILKVSAILLSVVFVMGFILPGQVHVERKIRINAQPQQIYPLISNFKQWERWSPWADIDPNAEFSVVGWGRKQTIYWSSDDPRVGQGSQAFVSLDRPKHIETYLDLGAQGTANVSFDLTPSDDATEVTWAFDTDVRAGVPIYLKPLSTYLGFTLDSMIGKDYEQGLNNLQELLRRLDK
ncbi:MAG: SRPBCC family protein [Cyanobacteria bacterium J06621_8]